MTIDRKAERKKERAARLGVWMALRSSRNKSLIDKLCRWIIERTMAKKAHLRDYVRDELIDNDLGFRAEDLEAYEQGRKPYGEVS